jgi:hypothetical protein
MVAKRFPIYGDREHMVFGTEQDAPLPFELKWRVNKYLDERSRKEGAAFWKEIDRSSSLNARLREAVREGEL